MTTGPEGFPSELSDPAALLGERHDTAKYEGPVMPQVGHELERYEAAAGLSPQTTPGAEVVKQLVERAQEGAQQQMPDGYVGRVPQYQNPALEQAEQVGDQLNAGQQPPK